MDSVALQAVLEDFPMCVCVTVCVSLLGVKTAKRGLFNSTLPLSDLSDPGHRERGTMSSDLDSSLTSIDWLPQLGISSLRSGKERGGGGERDKRRDRGRERGDFLPSLPDASPSNSKGKPPHSYATLIAMAIAAAPERKLSLNDIYTWISDTFPYYSRAGRGWKVSSHVTKHSGVS